MLKLLYKKTDKSINSETEIKNENDNNKRWDKIQNLFIDTFFNLNHKSKDDILNMVLLAGRCVLPQVVESEEKLMDDKDQKIWK